MRMQLRNRPTPDCRRSDKETIRRPSRRSSGQPTRVLHQPLAMLVGHNLRKLLETEPEFLRLTRTGARSNFAISCLPRLPRAPAPRTAVYWRAVSCQRVKAIPWAGYFSRHPCRQWQRRPPRPAHRTETSSRGKARIDFNTERFGFRREPAAGSSSAETDEITVVAHQRRHRGMKFGSRKAPPPLSQ